jgi:hypothetical protein
MDGKNRFATHRPTSRRFASRLVQFIIRLAVVAPSIQYPNLELSRDYLTAPTGEYGSAADRFLGQRLKASYVDMERERDAPYDAALYWRFLYEHVGTTSVFRAGLEEMACHPLGGRVDAGMPGAC